MTWKEYYESFYERERAAQVDNLSRLTCLGDPAEVAEIIFLLVNTDRPASNRLLEQAVAEKLAFKADDLCDMAAWNDKALVRAALYNSAHTFTDEDMEALYGTFEEETVIDIAGKYGLRLPEELREDDPFPFMPDDEDGSRPQVKFGFFPNRPRIGLFTALIGAAHDAGAPQSKQRSGRCSGDCAHCPPHYGYRYGRWYYGHDHVGGCEFGGNRGSGRMD